MAYSSTSDVQTAAGGAGNLAALADYDGDGTQDAAVIAAAIAAADALIDSYVDKRFATPLSPVPPKILELSARLAVYQMRQQRQTLTDGDTTQHTLDIEWLEGVRDGKNVPGVEPLPAKASLAVDQAGERVSTANVSRERLKGFW